MMPSLTTARVDDALEMLLGVINSSHMAEIRQTPIFRKWLGGLADQRATERIATLGPFAVGADGRCEACRRRRIGTAD